ncbi:MAG: Asp-tRNA(Asn)/Glu-tRNA(Gln) amidotransferase subunit GatB [Alphaproteobacteria bacterium]|nr:Asp-tRNA(Asn)/Glu-tRNA(Gln) amidotransferase subunit GatB [Alphaproteobacteria bacterium]MDD9920267.1 Asp-tRNA(Asn)/Glu-tRNA(Gln) amidotransferase subunit GatB [Alphaproteobacteria bacterium]
MHPDYEMVIGLEVHAQVNTKSKLFSGSSTEFGAEPNTQANCIDLGMPGMLPVLNQAAVSAGIKLGLAIGATVSPVSVFARKNYYYPDLPKGYQISQYEKPIVENGMVSIDLDDGTTKEIRVERMHLEEDAGKSVHDIGLESHSHVDLNRAGIPLMEIVSRPDLRTPEEAGAYMKKLRAILRFIDVCDGNMEQGSLRCDANVSVRKKGVETLGTRCEIKNLNSIRNVMRAIQYEADRQIDVLEDGGKIQQQTRLWDNDKAETRAMRSKEDAHDYRYFPDPDLLPLRVSGARITEIRETMPELPDQMKERFIEAYGLSVYDASVLTISRQNAEYFEAALSLKNGKPERDPKLLTNWMTVELFAALNKAGKDIMDSPVSPEQLSELVSLIEEGEISGKIAKQVFAEMLETSKDPSNIVEEKGLKQISDTGALEEIIQKVMDDNEDSVEKYRNGNERIFGFFVGQVMKATQGQANPGVVNELLKKALAG